MANSINITTAAFATLNMKPVPDEQVDSLWGQNIADNTGFLYKRAFADRPELSFTLTSPMDWDTYFNPMHGTFWFIKRDFPSGNGTFYGSISGRQNTVGAGYVKIRMNGTLLVDTTAASFDLGFGTDLGGIAAGAFVPVTYEFDNSAARPTLAHVSSWSKM